MAGLPFGLFKGQNCQFWPFLKLFTREKMVWPFGHFFGLFLMLTKKCILRPVLGKSEQISNIL
jgi:hypothetical protein